MKISEAIRKGAAISLPLEGELTKRDSQNNLYACALGAAHIGSGGNPDLSGSAIYPLLRHAWPILTDVRIGDMDLESAIWVKNDDEHQTREHIATWLEEQGY